MAEYITNGAKLKCSFGENETDFIVTNSKKVIIQNKAAANETDIQIVKNVTAFGKCMKQPTPSGSYLPCGGILPTLQWQACKSDVNVGGAKAVIDTSFLTCSFGGIIKPSDSGQK
jgi:hypothetical protein